MARVVSTHVSDNLDKKDSHPVFLLEMALGSHNYHYWTGRGDAGTYKADGTILELPEFDESFGLQAENISLRVGFKKTWIDTTGTEREINLSDVSLYRGKTMKLMLNYETTDSTWLGNPSTDALILFEGTITEIESYISVDESYYQITAESELVNLKNNKITRYSNQDQLNRFAGDVGLEYARQAQSSLLVQRGQEVPSTLYSRKIIYGQHKQDGDCVFASISGDNGQYLNLVYTFADHEIESYDMIYLDDRQVWETGTTTYHSNFNPNGIQLVNVYTKTGTDNQTSITELTTEVTSGIWSTNHRLRGIAYIYVRLQYETETFGDEIPRCSALIKGKKVYDPRTTTTAYSDNPALCLRDFLGNSDYGLGTTLFSDPHFTQAANTCDDQVSVTLNGSTTSEKRFTCSAILDSADTPANNINKLLSAFAGDIVYAAGKFHVHAGEHLAASVTLTLDDIYSEIDSYNKNYREVYNRALGTYVDPEIDYRTEEYPPFELSTAEEADERRLTLDLPATSKTTECQRIAKIAVMRSRQVKHLTFRSSLKMLKATAGDNIAIGTGLADIDGLYKVHSMRLNFDPVSIDVDLVATASTDYDFGADEYTAKPTISTEPDSSIIDWVNAKLPKPVFSHTSANFTTDFDVTISFDNTIHTCRYTTDGSIPTKNNSNTATQNYNGAITIPDDIDPTPADGQVFTIKALVHENSGSLQSDVASVAFTYVQPTEKLLQPISKPSATGRDFINVGIKKTGSSFTTGLVHRWKVLTGNPSGATSGLTLNYSTNGGASYSTTAVDEGDTFDVALTSSFQASNYKAYLTKDGYIQSDTGTSTGKPFIFFSTRQGISTGASSYDHYQIVPRIYGTGEFWIRSRPTTWPYWDGWFYKNFSGWGANVNPTNYNTFNSYRWRYCDSYNQLFHVEYYFVDTTAGTRSDTFRVTGTSQYGTYSLVNLGGGLG